MPDTARARILVVDDEPLFLRTTAQLLTKAGYECTTAADGRAALQILAEQSFDLVLSDLNMPGNLKLELLYEQRERWPQTPLIVITGVPSLPTAIESIRLGIADYLLKPVRYDDLLTSVQRALAIHAPRTDRPAPPVEQRLPAAFPELIGDSPAIRDLLPVLERVAISDANVLITGESGTGKEVVAQAIHRRSRRGNGPLQVIDCTSVPESLFESVLFGHARGAFTGAVAEQAGLLRQADGGSAFFDEIGELPASLQAKLLRVIQQQTFTPVGKTTPIRIDTRFLCATNRDLELEVHAGRFRRDLFYRLAVIHIELPPLRDRGDDVLLLARHFLQQLQRTTGRALEFAPETLELFRRYSWPGNVRELRNAVEGGLAMARHTAILPGDLPAAIQRAASLPIGAAAGQAVPVAETRLGAEREFLIARLRENAGNVARTAQQVGMSRQGLHKLLKKHGVKAADYRP
jgi:two-component system response regulator HydG